MILVDSCVLLDVLGGDPVWAAWSQGQLDAWEERGPLLINPVIYAELAPGYPEPDALESAIATAGLQYLEVPKAALFLAGKAHQIYRRRGGGRPGVLADFLIGGHAAVLGAPLLTRDAQRFRSYFPGVRLVLP
ncbi:MAG: type II toxin-antitoxin system VapC family toxin [Burkholderiales bacterium]|nr:type II toxin-antitoxin system VapC family toxin [Burkholderiales bacterium]